MFKTIYPLIIYFNLIFFIRFFLSYLQLWAASKVPTNVHTIQIRIQRRIYGLRKSDFGKRLFLVLMIWRNFKVVELKKQWVEAGMFEGCFCALI